MSEAIITARNTARELVETRIGELELRKNSAGQYDHDDIMTLKKGIENVLGSQWNALTPGKGVKMLLEKTPNVLTKIKETDVIDTDSILKTSKEEAATANAAAASGAEPAVAKITARVDAESEADRQNIARQAAIGAKEGTAAGISKHVGTDVTDSVLREADGNAKKVDEWHLHEIITEMIAAADRPATTSVLDALVEILQWQFDFRKRISANVEVLKAKNTKVKAFGLEATTAQLVLTIMANVEPAAEHDYGRAFRTPLETIRTTFKYDYKHDATSLKQVLDLLAQADTHRNMRDAPAPTELQANAVSSTLAALRGLVQDDMTEGSVVNSAYETAHTATSDNERDTSVKTYAARRHRQKKERKKKEKKKEKKRSSSRGRRRDTDADDEVNDCPHCKKFERRKAHPHVPQDKCMWNKKYKGYCFKSICDELEVNFKPRHKFSSKLGGYKDAKSDDESE